MQSHFASSLTAEHAQFTIGRVCARTPWRAAGRGIAEADRELAAEALVREADEYGADGVVEVAYEIEECRGVECADVTLRRLVATGRAVRLAMAA